MNRYHTKNRKKTVSLCMAVVLSLSLFFSVYAVAEETGGTDHNEENVTRVSIDRDNSVLTVAPGGTATLKLSVEAQYPEQVIYYWEYDDERGIIEGETSDTLILTNVTENTTVIGYAGSEYHATGTIFNVKIDNALTVTAASDQTTVAPGGNIEATASVQANNLDGLSYSWSYEPSEAIPSFQSNAVLTNADTDHVTVQNVDCSGSLVCTVTDSYGNTARSGVKVTCGGELSASYDGEFAFGSSVWMFGALYYYVDLNPDKTADIDITVNAYEGAELSYTWYGSQVDDANTSENHCHVKDGEATYYVRCYILDQYGNGCGIGFELREPVIKLGDVDGDAAVTEEDAMQVLRYDVNLISGSELNLENADVNGDGAVDTEDALLIQQYAAGAITTFPAG